MRTAPVHPVTCRCPRCRAPHPADPFPRFWRGLAAGFAVTLPIWALLALVIHALAR